MRDEGWKYNSFKTKLTSNQPIIAFLSYSAFISEKNSACVGVLYTYKK